MTEAEWLDTEEADHLREVVAALGSERKLRLLVAAILEDCRALLPPMVSDLIEANERIADGESASSLVIIRRQLNKIKNPQSKDYQVLFAAVNPDPSWAATGTAWHSWSMYATNHASPWRTEFGWNERYSAAHDELQRKQFRFVQCIFRTVENSQSDSWLSSTAVAIAEGIYSDKAFDRLPILADALQDAGCEDADILTHLRTDGPHVRGCWALDLVLGKE